MEYDVIIIGKGPAGLSASLYTTRSKLKTLIIGKDGELSGASSIENYLFIDNASGKDLLKIGEGQALKFGAEIIDDEVIGIKKHENTFEVSTTNEQYQAKSILLATGKSKIKVPIEGTDEYEGKGVHYCATCDGFFYVDTRVGILGYNDHAVYELKELSPITKDLTLYTNGNELDITEENLYYLKENNIRVNTDYIEKLSGEDFLEKIVFKDKNEEDITGLFVAYGTASSTDFARSLGVIIKDGNLLVNDQQETDVTGVYAAGNCTGGFAQVSTAVGEGAIAGQSIKNYLRKFQ